MLLQSRREAGCGGSFLSHPRITVCRTLLSPFEWTRVLLSYSEKENVRRHIRDATAATRVFNYAQKRSTQLSTVVSGSVTLTNIKPTKSPLPRYLNTFNAPSQQFLVLNLGGGSETICAPHLFEDGSLTIANTVLMNTLKTVSQCRARLCLMIFDFKRHVNDT